MKSIVVRNLQHEYEPGRPVLKIANLEIVKGERVFIFGPSGSGKTTLLGLIAGVLSPTQGLLQVLGKSVSELAVAERDRLRGEKMGYIFQMFNLLPYLTAFENIRLALALNPTRRDKFHGTKEITAEIHRLASALGIQSILQQKANAISVGQAQRVAAARALIGAPELLIADEPTSALDAHHRIRFIDLLLQEASRNHTTVLFVSHEMALATHFDRVLSLPEINEVGGVAE